MTAQFTPGPWRVEAKGPTMHNIVAGPDYFDKTILAFTANGLEEGSANARLIAAAPDMLLALQGYLSDCTNDECERCIVARAALAKARGDA